MKNEKEMFDIETKNLSDQLKIEYLLRNMSRFPHIFKEYMQKIQSLTN